MRICTCCKGEIIAIRPIDISIRFLMDRMEGKRRGKKTLVGGGNVFSR